MLINRVHKYIETNKLIEPGDKVIVGVSGGPDSMALLHILFQLRSSLQFEFVVAHVNHGLREEAGAEEEFVKEICKVWGIACYSCAVPVAEHARTQKITLEEAGRNARYDYFNQLQQKTGAQRIATAHHQNDVAETVLLHLLRGAGIKGLRGILPRRGKLIRPLLLVNKEELLEYLETKKIKYCQDQSNEDCYYLRNRIRHGLIPYLQKEFNPGIVGNLNQLALIARDENEALEQEVERIWTGILLSEEESCLVLDNKALSLLHLAYQRRIVMRTFSQLTGESGWTWNDVQKVIDLGRKNGSSLRLQLKKKVRVYKSYDRIIFTTKKQEKVKFRHPVAPGKLFVPEIGTSYLFELIDKRSFSPNEGEIYLDYDLLPKEIFLRSREIGDIFRPIGMSGSKKLKDFFIDRKVPFLERDRVALLVGDDREIYAVLGLGVSRSVAVNQNTRCVLMIKKC